MTTGCDREWSEQSSRRRGWRLYILVSVLALKLIRPLSLSLPPPLRYRGNHLSLWKIWINAHCTSFVVSQIPLFLNLLLQLYTLLLHPTFSHALFTLTSLPLFSLSHFLPLFSAFSFIANMSQAADYIHWNLFGLSLSGIYSFFTGYTVVYKTNPLPPLYSPSALC